MERLAASSLTDPVFADRWSPRSFSDQPVTEEELAAIFEAARWAPSWMNNQPWVFCYETDGPDREAMESIIMEFNRYWVSQAPVVGVIAVRSTMEGFMARTAEFDVGAAAMSMALQATRLGLIMHVLGGIELDLAHELTGLDPEEATILGAFAIGHQGDGSNLTEKHQGRERPSDRFPVEAFAFRGLRPGPRPTEEPKP
ncbi:MAG: nitroreductase family protein [Actinomycetota bacterium]